MTSKGKPEKKKNEIVQFGSENIESKFEMKLSQTDLVECAVSEKEEQCYSALEEIRGEIKEANKALNDVRKAVVKEADTIADSKYKTLFASAEKALKIVDKNVKITYLVDLIVHDKGIIKCAVQIAQMSNDVSNRALSSLKISLQTHILRI